MAEEKPQDQAAPEEDKADAKAPEAPQTDAKAADAPAKDEAKPKEQAKAGDAPAKDEAKPKEEPKPKAEPSRPAPSPPEGRHWFWGTGRRKTAIARVRIRPGSGKVLINKREVDDYFTQDKDRAAVAAPLQAARMVTSWEVHVNVSGGGATGQAGAVKLGLARAIAKAVPEVEAALRDEGLLTRDARMSERKKPGQPGARRRFQFSKR